MIRKRIQKNLSHARRGFTLIHMLVTISMMSVLLTITITSMITLLNRNQSVYLTSLHYKNMNRFSLEFRNDIHQANRVSLIKEENETGILIEKPNEEKTKYLTKGPTVYRLNEDREQNKSRNKYSFLPETKIEFSEENPGSVEAILRNPLTSGNSGAISEGYLPLKEFRIQAFKGRDHRFLKQENPENN